MRVVIKIIRIILSIVLTVLILANLWLLFAQYVLKQDPPKVFGYAQLIVTSGSMEPAFSPGDVVIIKEEEAYEMGDIVTFRQSGGSLVTHRIVGQNSQGFITRGDANNVEDSTLLPEYRIVGKVVAAVADMGFFLDFLKSPLGLLVIIMVGFLLIEVPILLDKRERKPKSRHMGDG